MGKSLVKRAYRYRFYPTGDQEWELLRTFGCVRLVYNKALEFWRKHARYPRFKCRKAITEYVRSAFRLAETGVEHLPALTAEVGVDAGLTALVTLSTGEKVDNPRNGRVDRLRLIRAQRALSRKQKGSGNRAKARVRPARVHARIADRRCDHLLTLFTRLVRENQTIVIEDLAVHNMVKSRRRAVAACGDGVRPVRR